MFMDNHTAGMRKVVEAAIRLGLSGNRALLVARTYTWCLMSLIPRLPVLYTHTHDFQYNIMWDVIILRNVPQTSIVPASKAHGTKAHGISQRQWP